MERSESIHEVSNIEHESEETYKKLKPGEFAIVSAIYRKDSLSGFSGDYTKLIDTLYGLGYNVITPSDAKWDIVGFGKSVQAEWPRDVFTQIGNTIYSPYSIPEVNKLLEKLGIPRQEIEVKKSSLGIGGNLIISEKHIILNSLFKNNNTEELANLKKQGYIVSDMPLVTHDSLEKSRSEMYSREISTEHFHAIEEIYNMTRPNDHIDSQINMVVNEKGQVALLVSDFYYSVFPEEIKKLSQKHNFDEIYIVDPIESYRRACNFTQLPDLKILFPGPNNQTKSFLQKFMIVDNMIIEHPKVETDGLGGSLRCRTNIIIRPNNMNQNQVGNINGII